MPDDEPLSPLLRMLLREIAVGESTALASFWRAVAERGTPLIDPDPDDETRALVTFLWRHTAATGCPVVMSPLVQPRSRTLDLQPLVRVPGTDVWYATGRSGLDLRGTYALSTGTAYCDFTGVVADLARIEGTAATFHTDPLNKHPFRVNDPHLPPQSTFALPAAPPQPWIVAQDDVPQGSVRQHRVPSPIEGGEQTVWVYRPPGYREQGRPYGLLLLFDGWAYLHWIPTPTILDNLLAARHLPPLVAVLIDNGGGPTRTRQLACSPSFADFIAGTLLPWVRREYHVTADPQDTIAGGSSLGGLAAAFLGLRHPGVVGKILCQAASFPWAPDEDQEAEWLTRQFATSPCQGLRLYLEIGLQELWGGAADQPNGLVATRHARDVLRARGYAVQYAEFNGGHDYIISWRGTLADGLLALTAPVGPPLPSQHRHP